MSTAPPEIYTSRHTLSLHEALPILAGAAAIALLLPPPAMAEDVPTRGAHDSRIRFVDYNPDQVVRINGVFRAASQIVFREGETIATVALGDTVSWEVAPADNALFIKPRESAQIGRAPV